MKVPESFHQGRYADLLLLLLSARLLGTGTRLMEIVACD